MHERLIAALGAPSAPRVIDAGCGLGGTVFHLHARLGGSYDGVTLSASQRERAAREALRRGVAGSCRFHLRSYDDDLHDLFPEGADLIVAIESLAHSPDPARTIASLARALRPGGRLAVIDDVPGNELRDDDPDFVGFKRGWHAHRLARADALAAAVAAARLEVAHEEDLTPLVILRNPSARERRAAVSRGLARVLGRTAAGQLIDALHGGMMLERLYARGAMRYMLVVARMPA